MAYQTTLTDKNLYAYCDNNPVVRKDAGGALVKACTKSDDTVDAIKVIKEAATKLNKGDNTVYVAYKGTTLEYVGITNDFERRKKEWEEIRK